MNLQIQNLILLMISKKWVSHPSPPPQITPLFLARPKLIKQHSCSSARSPIQNVPSRVHSKCLDWSSDIILAFLISVLLNQDSWLVWHVFRPEDLVLLVWWQNSPFIFHSQKYKQPLLKGLEALKDRLVGWIINPRNLGLPSKGRARDHSRTTQNLS